MGCWATANCPFELYAPASDGNDPQAYARDVAAAAGVPTTHLIRDLDDRQMAFMQDKICVVEGEVAGVELTRDSPDLPEVIRAQLM